MLNRIIATYSVTEEQVGQNISLATDLGNCSDIILDGKSLNIPISVNSGVVTPTSYGIYSDMTFTDDSWVVSPSQPWEITFDKPLQAGDMIGLSVFIPEYNISQNAFMAYEEMVSQGALTPIEPNNTQKFTSNYTTASVRIDCNILMCAFTPIDEDGTVTEDNFIGATYGIKSGGLPLSVIVKPTEATTYIVEYRFLNENATNTVITNISISATSVDLSSCDASNVTDMSSLFSGCTRLTSITFGRNFDTSNVTDMNRMFSCCYNLASLDVSDFDTSKVTNMNDMFNGCSGLTSLDLSNFNTSSVTDMNQMFQECGGLTSLDLSNFDTSKVTNMSAMFYFCDKLTLIIFGSQADVSKLTDMDEMFRMGNIPGTLYYPLAYKTAWDKIWKPSNFSSRWTAVPIDYENGETVPTV